MTPLASAISSALLHFVWQASIVAVLLWTTLLVLRNKSANSRYVAGCLAMALMALLPLVTTGILYSDVSSSADSTAVAPAAVARADVQAVEQDVWINRLQSWALPVWSFGVLVFSIRLLLGYQHAFRLRRRGQPAGESIVTVVQRLQELMSVRLRIQVLISPASDSPSVVGWLRPVILLPAATLLGLTPLQLEAILAHEIGHVRRYDYLVNMLQMLVETLLFYHPAIWWASRKVRLERELCCDDLAVRFSGNALQYARALTTLEKLRLKTPSAAMASTGGPLLYRIQRLVGVVGKEYGPSRLPIVLASGLGILCLTLNMTWVQGQDAPGITVDVGASSVIHRTPVRYPEAAQKQGITGTVQLEVQLDATGNVADAKVLAGPQELRKAALQSVLDWHFTSDAARDTRLVTIAFSDQGTQVQIRESLAAVDTARQGNEIEAASRLLDEMRRRFDEIKERSALATEDTSRAAQDRDMLRELERAAVLQQRNLLDQNYSLSDQQKVVTSEVEALQARIHDMQAAMRAAAEMQAGRGTIGNLITAGAGRGARGNAIVAGRILKVIRAPELSDAVRNELIARLPVREGDTLTRQLQEQIGEAVRSYDEHLRVQYILTDDGQAEIRIGTPVERR